MNNYHGVLLVNKEPGCTSHDVVARVRKIMNTKSVGHSGTLDPLASGLLVLLVGEGTKLSDYLLNGNKGYKVSVKLGVTTDSDDITGEVVKTSPVNIGASEVQAAVKKLTGELDLVPPIFSAIKVNGQKLYEKGRKQRESGNYDLSQVAPRRMVFFNNEIQSFEGDLIKATLDCSKGSYIRSWARHLGEILGTGACVEALHRRWSDPFSDAQALQLNEVEKNFAHLEQMGAFIPLQNALVRFDAFGVQSEDERWIRNGQITSSLFSSLIRKYPVFSEAPDGLRVISESTGKLVSVFLKEPGQGFRIKRVFNY